MAKFIITLPIDTPVYIVGGGNIISIQVISSNIRYPVVVLKAGIKGDSGDTLSRYSHNQASPALTWTINHNLNNHPSIVLLTIGGIEFNGQIIHTSLNQAIVYLVVATAGTAQCN